MTDALLADLQNTVPNANLQQPNIKLQGNGLPQQGISELDSLLRDLNSARNRNVISESVKRPSVDSLLDELSNVNHGQIYAVAKHQSPKQAGRQVTITVKETTTEKIMGTPSYGSKELPNMPETTASNATKELDDLMASLSDFKINSGHQLQSITSDYIKPNQGTAHYQTTLTTISTTEQNDHLDSMLGNLQADMSRQGINTTQKGCCNACEKPIVGQVITALGKAWHPEHFTCNHCNQELGTRNFFERDGYPYCEQDYHNLFSPRCAYCNGPILDKCVTALEKTWHTEHFFCAQCGQQFGEDGFHERDGKPFCRNDYFDMFAPKCNGCNRAIMENYISALNSQWHPDCFVCRDCKKAVTGKSFYALEGKPICPDCIGADDED